MWFVFFFLRYFIIRLFCVVFDGKGEGGCVCILVINLCGNTTTQIYLWYYYHSDYVCGSTTTDYL